MAAADLNTSQTPPGLLLYWNLGPDASLANFRSAQDALYNVLQSCMLQYLDMMSVAHGRLPPDAVLQSLLRLKPAKPGRRERELTGSALTRAVKGAIERSGDTDGGLDFGAFPEFAEEDVRSPRTWRNRDVLHETVTVRASSYTNPWWEVLSVIDDWLAAGGLGVAAVWTFKNAPGLMDLFVRARSFKSETSAKAAENHALAAEAELRRLRAVKAQLELARETRSIASLSDPEEFADLVASLGNTKITTALAADSISRAIPSAVLHQGSDAPRMVGVSESAAAELRERLLPAQDQALGLLPAAASAGTSAVTPPASAGAAEVS